MVLPYPVRLTPSYLDAVDPVQLRRDATAPVDVASRTALADLRPVITDPAVVVDIGQRALSLARSTFARAADATAPDLDVDESNVALRPTDAGEPNELFESAFAPDPTRVARESGFFQTAQTNAEATFQSALESTFPRAPGATEELGLRS